MTIDPRWAIYLSLAISFWNFFTGYSGLGDLGLDPAELKHVIAWGGLLVGFAGIANAALAGIPSKDNRTGFIIKGPPPPEPPKA